MQRDLATLTASPLNVSGSGRDWVGTPWVCSRYLGQAGLSSSSPCTGQMKQSLPTHPPPPANRQGCSSQAEELGYYCPSLARMAPANPGASRNLLSPPLPAPEGNWVGVETKDHSPHVTPVP